MNKTLVPTDFSNIANNAIEYIMALPEGIIKEVILLHAAANDDENLATLGLQKKRLSEKFKVKIIYSDKDFDAYTIQEIVQNKNIDLIIMGTSGETGGITKKIFGNNTSALIDNVNCPVLAIPVNYNYKKIKKIGYASDFTDLEKEMTQIISFARLFNATIAIVHVTPVFPDVYGTEKINIEKHIEQIKKKNDYTKIQLSIEKTTYDNQIEKGIEHFIEDSSPDMLVMFHHFRTVLDKIITSSVTVDSIIHLEIPLITFPK